MTIKLSIAVLTLMAITSCKDKNKLSQAEIDENVITKYITDNTLDASATGTGLHYTIDEIGTGEQPNITSTVTVVYKGYLTDGYVFDKSNSAGLKIPLTSVIKGWQEGIPLFKVGGSGTLLIPSALGYGSQGSGDIPENAVIIFDIELLKVE